MLSPIFWAITIKLRGELLAESPGSAFVALASVVLAVTGAEALYADMGHFGRGPIRRAWFALVLPIDIVSLGGNIDL